MADYRIMAAWIGHADLLGMAASLPETERKEIYNELKIKPDRSFEGVGPIKTLINCESFDEIHLLNNYKKNLGTAYVKWLGGKAIIHQVGIKNPTDYQSVFNAADGVLAEIWPLCQRKQARLCLHLSPGSPAMTAIWLLLGKSRYPATFYQTYKDKAWVTEVPFDLFVDFMQDVWRDPDKCLQHLAAQSPGEISGFENILGDSAAIRMAVGRAKRAALRQVPVLILGESGTGKELFAQAIHTAGARGDKPYEAVNCAAIPREMLEAELFGYKKGSFTGAVQDYAGAFERADGGTLFLDEIGECDSNMQSKLLRVLQPASNTDSCTRRFRRLGDARERTANVRVIAATNRDLLAAIKERIFREDLYYRLAVITVRLPPLRQRKADIPPLAKGLLAQINEQFRRDEPGYRDKTISANAMEFIRHRDWPGNIRELYNVLIQAAVLSPNDILDHADLSAALGDIPGRSEIDVLEHPLGDGFDLDRHLNMIHKHFLRRAMQEAGGTKTRAARLLGYKNYQTLDAQLKRLEVKW